eukprot:COSAG01_NODE_4692_length_4808_cov_9.520493_4_plen_152_part_00
MAACCAQLLLAKERQRQQLSAPVEAALRRDCLLLLLMLGLRRDLALYHCGPRAAPGGYPAGSDPRRQLLLIYTLKFLAAVGYFLVTLTLSLYLSDEMGYDDAMAGSMYGVLGMLISLGTLPAGWVIDRIGIRRSIVGGAALATVVSRLRPA